MLNEILILGLNSLILNGILLIGKPEPAKKEFLDNNFLHTKIKR